MYDYDEKNHFIIEELYIWEILQGKPEINFKGIYPLIEEFMILKKYEQSTIKQVRVYMTFLLARAKGQLKTCARLMRDFVVNHPEYKHDANVSNHICYDLIKAVENYVNIFDSLATENFDELCENPSKILDLAP